MLPPSCQAQPPDQQQPLTRCGLKGTDLANYAATDLADLWRAARRGLGRIRRNPALLWSFLAATGLTIPSTGS
jgi:hypothetical protein